MTGGGKASSPECAPAVQQSAHMRRSSKGKGLEPGITVCNALISACEMGKQPDTTWELLEVMQQKGLEPRKISY